LAESIEKADGFAQVFPEHKFHIVDVLQQRGHIVGMTGDGAILSIAYDNVHYKDQPEAWNMRMVLGVATVLGVIGVVSAFGLFYLGERVFHLDRAHIQTLMYLKLSVAGHLTIFLTRTRGPFWSIRPARILWVGVLGTQIVATLIAVYRLFMTPLGWGLGTFRPGLCSGLVPRERPRETAYVSGVRSDCRAPIGQETARSYTANRQTSL
jgi:magnesium-transporting ATPase (P-type)